MSPDGSNKKVALAPTSRGAKAKKSRAAAAADFGLGDFNTNGH